MTNRNLKWLTTNAIVCALYVALTIILSPLAYGAVQIRFSDILMVLPAHNKKFIPGLVLGTAIANMFSPLGLLDVFVGTLATLTYVLIIAKFNNAFSVLLVPPLVVALFIGWEMTYLFNVPFIITAISIFVGTFFSIFAGYILLKIALGNKNISKFLEE